MKPDTLPPQPFIIFPAIDLRGGRVVRLMEGNPERQTIYGDDPAATAERWLNAGAAWLHVVNLDGAFEGADQANNKALAAILKVAAQRGASVQYGGGLRTRTDIEWALGKGVSRAVLGTSAIRQPEMVDELLQKCGSEQIAVSLDARGGYLQVRGWQEDTRIPALGFAQRLTSSGLKWLVFTDIARDGLQTGINLEATIEMERKSGLHVIASGGVSSNDDVRSCRAAGLAGVIIGRALYEGSIDPQALFKPGKE